MTTRLRCALFAALLAVPSSAVAGELKISIQNGLATVVADGVPLSAVLAEWARVGQTKIVNGEQLTTMVTLHLVDVPEKKALEVLLRPASGFLVAERREQVAGASKFDRVVILPFSQAPAYAPAPPAPATPQPFVNRPQMPVLSTEPDDMPQIPGQQQPGNIPQTLPTPGMLPQPIGPAGQQPQLTSPRPGFLPPPAPVKPPGGGQ